MTLTTSKKRGRRKKSVFEKYIDDVISGKITASKKIIQACKRHKNDLKRQGTKNFPYTFDLEKAYRPIEFMETFCKPSKGNFENLELLPWQHFVIGSLYGWVHKDTGLRRFYNGFIFVARKNGKSTMMSGLAPFAVSKDGEPGADVYLLANSKEQASIVFQETVSMVKSSPALSKNKRFRPLRDVIFYDKTAGKIQHRASDSRKLDGLNTHLGIFDEMSEYQNYKLMNVINNSTGARQQPLLIFITTAGYVLDGPCVDYYQKAADVLDGIITDETFFAAVYEIDEDDDIEDSKNWIKANPSIGKIKSLDKMIADWERQKLIPSERTDFITKVLNVFSSDDEMAFLDAQTIFKNNKVIPEQELLGRPCVGGYDLSDTEDITAAGLSFPLEDGTIAWKVHGWVTEKKVIEDAGNRPFREWAEAGYITICRGDYVDHTLVYDWFMEQNKLYTITKIMYDPAKAYRLNQDLEASGFLCDIVRQGFITLGPAMQDLKQLFLDAKICNINPFVRWNINNVSLVTDRNNNWMPKKNSHYRKIDAFAAMLNAHVEVMKIQVYINNTVEVPDIITF